MRCLLWFHKWSDWQHLVAQTTSGTLELLVSRYCLRCGKPQIR